MNDQQSYYETMYILRPDIAEEEVTNHINKYNKLLEEVGGTILDSQMRGKRRLAYQIAKHREGVYVQLSHQGDGQHIFKIEKAMRLSEDVIRYIIFRNIWAENVHGFVIRLLIVHSFRLGLWLIILMR